MATELQKSNAARAQAVLFDLDGVLVRTDRLHFQAWKRVCDSRGWRFDEQVNHLLRGVPRMDSLRIILRHNGAALPPEAETQAADEKNAFFRESLKTISKNDLIPGALELVQGVRALGAKTAICSSSRNASDIVKALGIAQLFDAITTANEVTKAKPAPEIFLVSAKLLGMPPELCVVVEDAQAGLDAARAAGMRCVGFGEPNVLKGATLLLQSFEGASPVMLLEPERQLR